MLLGAMTNQKPVVSGPSVVTSNTNTSFTFTSLISASDPDGSVASYTFFDAIAGAGHLTLNGAQIVGTSVTVAAANLGQVGYVTGATVGTNAIAIDAFDNQIGRTTGRDRAYRPAHDEP